MTAFASVARSEQAPVSAIWLSGWIMIAIHFATLFFAPLAGPSGTFASFLAVSSLIWAALLFTWASVPFRDELSARCMLIAAFGTNTFYVGITLFTPGNHWLLGVSALLVGIVPLTIALVSPRRLTYPPRNFVAVLNVILAICLLVLLNRPENRLDLALDAVIFAAYLCCCAHFLYAFRLHGTGVFVTTFGFLAWSSVFVVAPLIQFHFPTVHVESEVWNLPKYIVAMGMILILLEQQIEHNRHLALHDELTGLPNRRLFQDRLVRAIERSNRTGSQVALLLIDLDRFKQVNDSVGHHVGDEVLKQVAKIFLGRIRRSDTVARTGGDEFSIILEDPVTREDAQTVCRSLIELLHQSLALDGYTICVGASIGLALYPHDAVSSEALRIAADLSMYEQKNDTHRNDQAVRPIGPKVEEAATRARSTA